MQFVIHHVQAFLALSLGLAAIVTRRIGFGAGSPRPQFTIQGPLAVALGVAVTGIGVWLMQHAV